MKLGKKEFGLLLLNCLFSIFGGLFTVAFTHYASQILNAVEEGNGDLMAKMLVGAVIAMMLRFAFWVLDSITEMKFLAHGVINARDMVMKNILERPLLTFRKKDDSYYINLLGEDMELYRNSWLKVIPGICACLVGLVADAVMLCLLHPTLFLVGVITTAIPFLTSSLFTKVTQQRRKQVSAATECYTGMTKEGIEGYETVRISGEKTSFLIRFHAVNKARAEAQCKSGITNRLSFMALYASGSITKLVCIGVSGYLSLSGLVPIAAIFASTIYSGDLSNQVSNLMGYIVDFRASKPLVEKLKAETEVPRPADGGLMPAGDQSLVYENVSFGFGDRQLYENLSCAFAPGGCYAILGESGSGKSTLTKLLLKYYDDYQGKITLAGQDIRDLSEEEIYRVVGLVSQSPFLFNASLYENITMFTNEPARDSAEYEKLLADLNLTALAQRVGDAPLGDFGDNISGGERQRINIARALRSHPSILIFDEPTTGLDPENVALIDQFIFDRKDVTRIVITHNWSEDYLSRFDAVLRIGEKAPAVLPG